MKKTIAIILALLVLFSVTACRDNKTVSSDINSSTEVSVNSESDSASEEDISSEEDTDDTVSVDTSDDDFDDDFEDDFTDDWDDETDDTPSSSNTNTSSKDDSKDTSSDTEDTATVTEVDLNDKAYVKNPAPLSYPMTSKFDKEADALRNKILNKTDALPSTVTGNIWYISNSGNDKNSGNSKNAPWATLEALNAYGDRIKAGDAVLFERGDVFRGSFSTKSGVYYGAYGTGDKPCIYGSAQNYAKVNWKKKFGNVWICDTYIADDVGIIVFNHGESVGYKRDKKYEMQQNGDFWCEGDGAVTLYLYMDKNPAEAFKSIEIGIRKEIIYIKGSENVTVENLCLKYTGAHAISGGGVKNVTVKNCEIGFIGGSYLKGYWRQYTRYGNGIQFWSGNENVLVENNWIYQIYDSGITHQGDGNYTAKNLTFNENLVEYCGMGSIEYWTNYYTSEDGYNISENVTYSNNILRFAGYCWGGIQRFDKERSGHIISDTGCHNNKTNFKIINNIFDQSTAKLIDIGGLDNTFPVLSGNTYAQSTGGLLGTYAETAEVTFDKSVANIINTIDNAAKVVWY